MLTLKASKEKLYVPSFYELISGKIKNPIILLSGGRGSSKSTSTAQFIVRKCLKEKKRVALVRKYFKYIRESQHEDISTHIERLRLSEYIETGLSPLGFSFPNNSQIISFGLDKQKVKSLSGVKLVWVEELTELTQEDWVTLVLTVLRGEGSPQIIATYNPQFGSWINDYFFYPDGTVKDPDLVYHQHSTYKENPYVGDVFIRMIESLSKEQYDIHGLGIAGKMEGLIFDDYTIIDQMPDVPFNYGVDKGFNDAFAIVKTGYQDGNLYADEIYYEKYRLTAKVINSLSEEDKKKEWKIDDSAADTIKEFQDAKFNASGANKGKITDGIMKMKQCKLFVTKRSVNLIRELSSYTWLKDSRGVVHDEPTQNLSDHAIDAWRYGAINLIKPKIKVKYGGAF